MLMIDVQRFFVTVVIISQKILNFVLSLSISLSISTAVFPGASGLAGFITGCAVCYNGDVSFLWENGNFDPL